jgi:hypothetical protein
MGKPGYATFGKKSAAAAHEAPLLWLLVIRDWADYQ